MIQAFEQYQKKIRNKVLLIFVISTIATIIMLDIVFLVTNTTTIEDIWAASFLNLLIGMFISGIIIKKYERSSILKWLIENFSAQNNEYNDVLDLVFVSGLLKQDSVKSLEYTDIKDYILNHHSNLENHGNALFQALQASFKNKKRAVFLKGYWFTIYLFTSIPLFGILALFITYLTQLILNSDAGIFIGLVFSTILMLILIFKGWQALQNKLTKFAILVIDTEGVEYLQRRVAWEKIKIEKKFIEKTEMTLDKNFVELDRATKDELTSKFHWTFEVEGEAPLALQIKHKLAGQIYQAIFYYSQLHEIKKK